MPASLYNFYPQTLSKEDWRTKPGVPEPSPHTWRFGVAGLKKKKNTAAAVALLNINTSKERGLERGRKEERERKEKR